MIIPVRCISCGRPISNKWETFKAEVSKGKNAGKVLDELGIKSYCCRAIFLTHVDLIDSIAIYKKRIVPKAEEVAEAEIRVIAAPIAPVPEAEEIEAEVAEEEVADLPKAKGKKE